jgi:chorismate-pyruvate lyase
MSETLQPRRSPQQERSQLLLAAAPLGYWLATRKSTSRPATSAA